MARYFKKRGVNTALCVLAVALLVGVTGAITKGFTDWKFDDNVLEKNDRKNLAKIDLSNNATTSVKITSDTLVEFLESNNKGDSAIVKGLGTKLVPATTEGGTATTSLIAPVETYKADGGLVLGSLDSDDKFVSGSFSVKLDESIKFNRIAIVGRAYSTAVYKTETKNSTVQDVVDSKGNKVVDHYKYDNSSISVNEESSKSLLGNIINRTEVAKTETKVFKLDKATNELSITSIDGRVTILEIQTWLE